MNDNAFNAQVPHYNSSLNNKDDILFSSNEENCDSNQERLRTNESHSNENIETQLLEENR